MSPHKQPLPSAGGYEAPPVLKRSLESLEKSTTSSSSFSAIHTTSSASKSQRLTSPIPVSLIKSSMKRELDLRTPPATPPDSVIRTMRLQLTIPQEELTKAEQRTLKIRRASAERWKPKLQRPFPAKKEINEAYKYKLMRHYTSQPIISTPNFVKPRIDKSPRVDRLLKRFPVLSTSFMASKSVSDINTYASQTPPVPVDLDELAKDRAALKANKMVTKSEHAQRLAWTCFSSQEQDGIDQAREAMMQSGLWDDDLERENLGQQNELPEWRKVNTGRFARKYHS